MRGGGHSMLQHRPPAVFLLSLKVDFDFEGNTHPHNSVTQYLYF